MGYRGRVSIMATGEAKDDICSHRISLNHFPAGERDARLKQLSASESASESSSVRFGIVRFSDAGSDSDAACCSFRRRITLRQTLDAAAGN
ncbi:hypothetical protein DY000_02031908 [Brassica cretica]|uniref:Uncharacterized protein n=1 Tax=Brassica cretica TaxID=69181 RepID=A0ABQ7DST8_BRACR|nr:hypothetical protein DY000_02031908 [Brassica cretica]